MDIKDWLPSSVTIIVFLLGFWRQNWLKRQDRVSELENILIHTTDKMLRFTISYEQRGLEVRRNEELIKIGAKDERDIYSSQFQFFQKRVEDLALEYELLRAELKKNVKDVVKYLPDNKNKRLILEVLERVVFFSLRDFPDEFYEKFTNVKELNNAVNKKSEMVFSEIMFDGIGYHLIYMQRLIDQHSPILYVKSEEDVKRLNDRITNYAKYAADHDKKFHK